MRLIILVALSLVALLSASAQTQLWRSTLYSENWIPPAGEADFASKKLIQDFSYAGYQLGERTLEAGARPVFNVLNFGADASGRQDSTAAIQSAIDQAATVPGGAIVRLPSGTYRIIVPAERGYGLLIKNSGIVLQGDGPAMTRLWCDTTEMRGKQLLRVSAEGATEYTRITGAGIALTRDVLGPSHTLHVASTEGLAIGSWIVVKADLTAAWREEHREPLWQGSNLPTTAFSYLRQITALDAQAGTIEIDIPLRYFVKQRDNARILPAPVMLEEVGLEGFSVGNTASPREGWNEDDWNVQDTGGWHAHTSYAILFRSVRNGWMRDVHSFQPEGNKTGVQLLSSGLKLQSCRSLTIERCHFGRPQFGGAGGNGYMFMIDDTQETLFAQCSSNFARHGYVFGRFGSCGNVLWACVDRSTGRSIGNGRDVPAILGWASDHHMWFSHSNLLDSCVAEKSSFDAFYRPWSNHGITAAHTVFWNTRGENVAGMFEPGTGRSTPPENYVEAVIVSQQARYGYVIGTSGSSPQVETKGSARAGYDRTDPVDHVEGVGQGSSLVPQSLYLDQLRRRLNWTIAPAFSPAGGSYSSAQSVTLSSATPGASIRYTLDGSEPSETNGLVFAGSLPVARSMTIKARAFAEGLEPSAVVSADYLIEMAVKPVADAYVRDGTYAATNYGADPELVVKAANVTGFRRAAHLKFDLTSVASVNRATLKLQVKVAGPDATRTISVYGAAHSNWTENGLTWSNAPGNQRLLGNLVVTNAANTSYLVDLTDYIREEKTAGRHVISLVLTNLGANTNDNTVSFASKEAPGGSAQLVIVP